MKKEKQTQNTHILVSKSVSKEFRIQNLLLYTFHIPPDSCIISHMRNHNKTQSTTTVPQYYISEPNS